MRVSRVCRKVVAAAKFTPFCRKASRMLHEPSRNVPRARISASLPVRLASS
jgi:hypothetical protein